MKRGERRKLNYRSSFMMFLRSLQLLYKESTGGGKRRSHGRKSHASNSSERCWWPELGQWWWELRNTGGNLNEKDYRTGQQNIRIIYCIYIIMELGK